tara:strand:+ start:427 stop:1005 length:579 start_codon:yes stop_codon:yes gene_type:complete
MNRIHAFTLIEMLVTIAIAAILLALAIPSFRESTLNNQRAARVNELVTELNYARTQAVSLRQTVSLCRVANPGTPVCGSGNGWEDGWVIFVDNNSDGAIDAGEDILRRHGALISAAEQAKPSSQKFTIRGNGTATNGVMTRVSFRVAGNVSPNSNGTLAVCDQRNDIAKGRAIVIGTGGRIRTSEGVTTCQR